jgi:hypothetical protein
LGQLILKLRKEGKTTWVVLNIPVDPVMDPRSDVSRSFSNVDFKETAPLAVDAFDRQYGEFLGKLKATAEQSGATVVDPLVYLKKDRVYPRTNGGSHLYRDSCHLRASYVRDHVTYLDSTVSE